MPIPPYDEMLRTILALAEQRDITRRSATEAMAEHFKLTSEEVATRLPSGSSTYVRNRAGWAMTFLTKAGLIEKSAPKTYRITESGKQFLQKHPTSFLERDLKAIPGYREAWESKAAENTGEASQNPSIENSTPEDTIDYAINLM